MLYVVIRRFAAVVSLCVCCQVHLPPGVAQLASWPVTRLPPRPRLALRPATNITSRFLVVSHQRSYSRGVFHGCGRTISAVTLAVGDWLLRPATVFFTVGFVLVFWAAIGFLVYQALWEFPDICMGSYMFFSLSSPLGLYTPFTSLSVLQFPVRSRWNGFKSTTHVRNIFICDVFFGNTACLFR